MAEKSLSEITRDVRLLYQRASDALLRENFDYAIDLFNQVLEKEPTLFDARKALRTAQAKKAGSGRGFFKKAWSSASSSPMVAKAQLALRKNPAEALQVAEQVLNSDPANSGAHRVVVEAANAMNMPRTAVMSLDVLARSSPRDKTLAIQFATALANAGDVRHAEKLLVELARILPNDPDIAQALKDLSARKTLDEGGYDALAGGQGSYRDILKDETEAKSIEQEGRVQKTEDTTERLIKDYEARLKTEPSNLKLLRNLADLYTQKKQFERALEYYDRIKSSEMGANDPTLARAIAEIHVRRYEHQLAELDPTSPAYAETTAKLNAEKLEYQINECRTRVDRFPTDLAIRFEMGALYFQAGKISEAIKEFQKAKDNPHKRIAAMKYLAQCFAKRKMFDLAAENLQEAIKEKSVFDDEKKELIYDLGCVLENMGRKEPAIEQFKIIYKMDIGYRDVETKVNAFYDTQ